MGDRAALSQAMRTLLRDPEAMERISRNGCALRQQISPDVIAGQWKAYIESICAG